MSHLQTFVTVVLCTAILSACGEVSPKLVSSGSSDFGFIEYFIEPVNDSVIAVEQGTQSTSFTTPLALTPKEVQNGLKAYDTKANVFNTSYCDYLAENFASKTLGDPQQLIDSNFLVNEVLSAPFVAEKSYLELIKNYCYTNKTFYLNETRVQEENNAELGKIRWFRNSSTSLGGGRIFDYLISQAIEADDTIRLLSTYKESGVIAQEQLFGKVDFTEYPSGDRELSLLRYFVDYATKADAVPKTFRQEAYAMHTSKQGEYKVHHIASFLIDHNNKGTVSATNQHQLILHINSAVVAENWGSKIVNAEYCIYPSGTVQYNCDASDRSKHAKIEASSNSLYYDTNGNKMVDSNDNKENIDNINNLFKKEILDRLLKQVTPPLKLRQNIDLNAEFDTTSNSSHLKFERHSSL